MTEQPKHTRGPLTEPGPALLAAEARAEQRRIEEMARARIAEAAPTMLAVLQELEEFLDNRADVDDGIPNDAMRLLVEVQAAIAKATGGP